MAYLQTSADGLAAGMEGGSLAGNDVFIGIDSVFHVIPPSAGASFNSAAVAFTASAADTTEFLSTTGHLGDSQHRSYHYRFVLVKNPLDLSNPPLNADIGFNIWNTFPDPDVLIDSTVLNSDVLTTDLLTGVGIRDFEWRLHNIQLSPGPSSIDAQIVFDFTQGLATLYVMGEVLLEAPVAPSSITETWSWVTKIIQSFDGSEQRIRLMPSSKKSISMNYETDEDDYREFAKVIRKGLVTSMSTPHFQYQTFLTRDALSDTDRLYFNPDYTQLSVGDSLYITSLSEGISPITNVVKSFTADGCIVETALTVTAKKGLMICPLREVYLDKPTQSMQTVTGSLTLKGEEVGRSRKLLKTSATISPVLFNGAIVVQEKVLADMKESYPYEFEDFTTNFGSQKRVSAWDNPRIDRAVRFMIPNKKSMATFNWWMNFLDTVAGSHQHFYLPTSQSDLRVINQPFDGAGAIEVLDHLYTSTYKDDVIWSQVEITQTDGTKLYRTIVSSIAQGAYDVLTLSSALPVNISDEPIARVSFMHKVRMAGDKVTIDHKGNRAYINFSVIGIPQ
jgi:hypothetical protein